MTKEEVIPSDFLKMVEFITKSVDLHNQIANRTLIFIALISVAGVSVAPGSSAKIGSIEVSHEIFLQVYAIILGISVYYFCIETIQSHKASESIIAFIKSHGIKSNYADVFHQAYRSSFLRMHPLHLVLQRDYGGRGIYGPFRGFMTYFIPAVLLLAMGYCLARIYETSNEVIGFIAIISLSFGALGVIGLHKSLQRHHKISSDNEIAQELTGND